MTQLKRIGGPLMKKLVCFAVIFLGLSAIAMAQDFPRGEVFGGYSYFSCNNPVSVFGNSPGQGCRYNGWDISVALNGNKWLSFVGDLSGYYKSDNPPPGMMDHYHFYSILVGPRVSVRKINRVTPFVQTLFGDARVTPGKDRWSYENDFAMALGGGVDIKAYKNFSVRPFQFDYMLIKSGQPLTDNIRFNFGIAWNFGAAAK